MEQRLKNIALDITIKDDVKYRGFTVAAVHQGYRRAADGKLVVFISLHTIDGKPWWNDNEDMLMQVLAHETGHAIFAADRGVSYNFRKLLGTQNRTELQEYVEQHYEESLFEEEMFAYKFQALVSKINNWSSVAAITTDLVEKLEDIKKWIR